jgi:glutamine amidotransferase
MIHELIIRYGKAGPSYFNCCFTNGQTLFATRYCSDKKIKSESLYYAFTDHHINASYGIIASEKVKGLHYQWEEVPENTVVFIEKNAVSITQLDTFE